MIILLFDILLEDEIDLVDRIFLKMNKKMYNICFRILNSHADTEDAIAQTFIKIMDNIKRISALPCPQIEPYCVVILKNEAMNIIRKRKKNIYVEGVDCFEFIDEGYNMEEEYLKTADKEKLVSCINRLSDEEKNLIHLRFIYDMSFKNISQLMDITEETAKKRGQRILKKLRLYYEEGENSAYC